MKQFLEDYDDEQHDSKYYKCVLHFEILQIPQITGWYCNYGFCSVLFNSRGKELQRRLADRAKELEADNKDRQREREELEEMRLRMLTSSATSPSALSFGSRFDKVNSSHMVSLFLNLGPVYTEWVSKIFPSSVSSTRSL